MNEQQLAAVKQALEALEMVVVDVKTTPTAYEAHRQAITALQSIISQDALYKMAEDAVTIGLSYNDWPKIGCVNHDCDQCKAVQEPAAWGIIASNTGRICQVELDADEVEGHNPKHIVPLYTTPPAAQPVPVKTYHDGRSWPVAPKPWVGLTDEEIHDAVKACNTTDTYKYFRAIEAILKEKNT